MGEILEVTQPGLSLSSWQEQTHLQPPTQEALQGDPHYLSTCFKGHRDFAPGPSPAPCYPSTLPSSTREARGASLLQTLPCPAALTHGAASGYDVESEHCL